MTYDEYKAQMTRNRERLEENERTVELSIDDIEFFASFTESLNVLVITEAGVATPLPMCRSWDDLPPRAANSIYASFCATRIPT